LPDSYGKRQRNQVKAKKATAREERRVARNERRAQRAADALGGPPPEVLEGEPDHEDLEDGLADDGEPDESHERV
jgi:hypothetical protein